MARFYSLLSLGKHASHQNARALNEALNRFASGDAEAGRDALLACQRLGAALKLVEPLYQRQKINPLRKKVKDLTRTLLSLREAEALVECARRVPLPSVLRKADIPPAAAGALHLISLLDDTVELKRIEMAAIASQPQVALLSREIERAIDAPGLHRGKVRRYPRLRLHEIAARDLRDHLTALHGLELRRAALPAELNPLRAFFRKLRCSAEFFGPALPQLGDLVNVLARPQRVLEDLHAASVAMEQFQRLQAVEQPEEKARQLRARLGAAKLLAFARNEQARLRDQFSSVWNARVQRDIEKQVDI